jgi:hypothetical protein
MRRHELITRIFLLLSIFNYTFMVVAKKPARHEMRVNVMTEARDVTETSDSGHTQSEELPKRSGRPPTAGHLYSRLDPLPEAEADEDPETKKFVNKELEWEFKEALVLGGVGSIISIIAYGVQSKIWANVSPGAYVLPLFYLPPANT